jgi:superoxide dismutase, Cu-Zn family
MRTTIFASLLLLTCATPLAAQDATATKADIIGNNGQRIGSVDLRGTDKSVIARITLEGGAVSPGWHGIHFHSVADCSDTAKFEKSKGHVNHAGAEHGLLNKKGPDQGDLPNIYANNDGSANAEVTSSLIGLAGDKSLTDADGSALIFHANADDHATQPIGGAGDRVACAEIKK